MKNIYTCNQCGNYCSGNKRKCRQCNTKDWLWIDADGMVNLTLDFSNEEMLMLTAGAKAKYKLTDVTKADIQHYVEETLTEYALEIKAARL